MSASPFLPTERAFWLAHLGASAGVVLLTLLSARVWGPISATALASTLVWPLPFTAVFLGLRQLYLRHGAARWPLSRLIPRLLLACTLAGFVVAAAVQLLVWLLLGSWPTAVGNAEQVLAALRWTLSGGLQAQLFLCAWSLVLVGFDQQRRAVNAELQSLRLQHSLKEAQLAQLAQQLNPHFLFNALNNLRFLAQQDAAQADALMVSLSNLLRHALQSSQHPQVRLDDELALVRDYLALMQCQLEARLQVQWHIEPGLGAAALPPMVLQLLVENAVRHGLEPLPQGGVLDIAVSQAGPVLQLRVGNACPGEGQRGALGVPGTGLGLRNVRQRLALLYGDSAQLALRQRPGHFEVQLQLPLVLL